MIDFPKFKTVEEMRAFKQGAWSAFCVARAHEEAALAAAECKAKNACIISVAEEWYYDLVTEPFNCKSNVWGAIVQKINKRLNEIVGARLEKFNAPVKNKVGGSP